MSQLELKGFKLLREIEQISHEVPNSYSENIIQFPIAQLKAGEYQPRSLFEQKALQELCESIKTQGILQPLIIRKNQDLYEIVAGERRFRAAIEAGLTHVPVLLRELDDKVACAFALIENLQRKDLTAFEEAKALARFRDEFHMLHEDIAKMIGVSREAVTNSLRLLKLEPSLFPLLEANKIQKGHALVLLTLPLEAQVQFAAQIVEEGLSVRALEKKIKAENPTPKVKLSNKTHHEQWQQALKSQFKQVLVTVNDRGKTTIRFDFSSLEEAEAFVAHCQRYHK